MQLTTKQVASDCMVENDTTEVRDCVALQIKLFLSFQTTLDTYFSLLNKLKDFHTFEESKCIVECNVQAGSKAF